MINRGVDDDNDGVVMFVFWCAKLLLRTYEITRAAGMYNTVVTSNCYYVVNDMTALNK